MPTRVLVIDDSRAMRSIIRGQLSELGYEVTEAPDGQEALAVLEKSGPFDLAVVDWNMPRLNGLEFVTQVREMPAMNRMRLMMCTTETEMAQVSRALSAGANEYIMKPFTREAIREKLSLLGLAA